MGSETLLAKLAAFLAVYERHYPHEDLSDFDKVFANIIRMDAGGLPEDKALLRETERKLDKTFEVHRRRGSIRVV